MFARTDRLMLRHGWLEDAAALRDALAQDRIECQPALLDWPVPLGDVAAYLGRERGSAEVDLLIFRRTEGRPELIGGVAIVREGMNHRFGCWLRPSAMGKGYAMEAGRAVLAHAREALRLDRLIARSLGDGRADALYRRLGFHVRGPDIGRVDPCGLGGTWLRYQLDFLPLDLAA